jgi:hypothetical protein
MDDVVPQIQNIPTHAMELWQARQLNNKLMSNAASTFGATAGLGAATAGGIGLFNLLRRNLSKTRTPREHLIFSVPTSADPAEEMPKAAGIYDERLKRLEERRGETTEQLSRRLSREGVDRFHGELKHALGQDKEAFDISHPIQSSSEFLGGVGAPDLESHPLAGAAMTTAAMGGLYGGYKLIDKLLNWRRKKEIEGQLEDARQQYNTSLQGLIQPKTASDEAANKSATLDDKLKELYEHSKQANFFGGTANALLTAWPPLALLGGVGGYNLMRSHSQSRLLDKAIRRQQREQLAHEPMYAFPDYRSPADQPQHNIALPEQEDEKALEAL